MQTFSVKSWSFQCYRCWMGQKNYLAGDSLVCLDSNNIVPVLNFYAVFVLNWLADPLYITHKYHWDLEVYVEHF